MSSFKITLNDLNDTQILAKKIADSIEVPMIVTMNGDLGAGKTTLVREIILALGVTGRVKSPTFTLLEEYDISLGKVLHFDLYRFADPEEWLDLGFDELLDGNSYIAFIEWAERAQGLLKCADWKIDINVINENMRELNINGQTDLGEKCLRKLIKVVEAS